MARRRRKLPRYKFSVRQLMAEELSIARCAALELADLLVIERARRYLEKRRGR